MIHEIFMDVCVFVLSTYTSAFLTWAYYDDKKQKLFPTFLEWQKESGLDKQFGDDYNSDTPGTHSFGPG